jgi:hypothetical protein
LKAKIFKLLVLISIFFSGDVFSSHLKCEAMVRDKRKRLVKRTVELPMEDRGLYENESFKIVEGQSDQALSLGSSLSLRACTAFYHLTKARSYFVNELGLEHLNDLKQIIIRLQIKNGYHDASHFVHTNHGEFFNNALTIPPSDDRKLSNVKSWDYEIWFAPKKKKKIKSQFARATEQAGQQAFILGTMTGMAQSQVNLAIQQWASTGQLSIEDLGYHAKSLLFSVGVVAGVPLVLKGLGKIAKKTIYLDAGLIPEVIYHEFTHVALAKFLSLEKHSAVVEGTANYFAANIGKTNSILGKTKKFAKGLDPLKGDKLAKKYDYFMEDQMYAQYGFTFKFLYALKKKFGEKTVNRIILEAIKYLDSPAPTIKKDLIPALFKSIKVLDMNDLYYPIQSVVQEFGI